MWSRAMDASPVRPRALLLLGTLLWAGADEAALPALGLSAPPVRYPAPTHAEALAPHLVDGLTTDTVRRLIRRTLS